MDTGGLAGDSARAAMTWLELGRGVLALVTLVWSVIAVLAAVVIFVTFIRYVVGGM